MNEQHLADSDQCERVARKLAWALRCAASGCAHRPAVWHAEDAAQKIADPDVRARALDLCRAARDAGGYGADPEYFPEPRVDATAVASGATRSKRAKKPVEDTRHFAVEAATLEAAKLFASAPWQQPDGSPWPDGGRAMVRGATITLAFEEWARAYGMTAPPIVEGFAELGGVLDEARAAFRALPLVELTPEYFGHVHETLVGYAVKDGQLVPNGGRRKLGAHFTPASLARKVVRRTMDPILRLLSREHGPGGLGHRVLTLKVCDPAVGAGAFGLSLVRLLAGVVKHSGPAETIEEAKRLIALHVFHGVDVDRYGVLACKLALRLECRADRMPMDWLDHAIKHGDALVGLEQGQIKAFHWKREQPPLPGLGALYGRAIDGAVRAAMARREQLASQARYA